MQQGAAQAASTQLRIRVREVELYPELATYLWNEYRVYPKPKAQSASMKSVPRVGTGAMATSGYTPTWWAWRT